jgi:uncharacterized cupin superfamily protein
VSDVKYPVHESELPWETWYAGSDREVRGKSLCDHGGRAKVGVGLMELPPGSNTRPAHYHSLEEEHLFVVAGRATLHLGSRTFDLRSGSYVCFPAGQPEVHYLENAGSDPFRYLMIGERIAGDEVLHAS